MYLNLQVAYRITALQSELSFDLSLSFRIGLLEWTAKLFLVTADFMIVCHFEDKKDWISTIRPNTFLSKSLEMGSGFQHICSLKHSKHGSVCST